MEKGAKRRGRPAIKPYIDWIIRKRVLEEQAKPHEGRMLVKVLAYAIREEIKEIQEKEGLNELPPESSTLEKKIAKGKSAMTLSPEDKPWSIFTLGHYPIPPEALPNVLAEYGRLLSSPHVRPPRITIRQAKWIGRLSATESFKLWPHFYLLVSLAEELLELLGEYPLPAQQLLKLLHEHAHFALIDQALAELEAGETERALILYDACESLIYHRYDRMSDHQKEEPKEGGKGQ